MSNKLQLSNQRKNMVINGISKYQEMDCNKVIEETIEKLSLEFDVNIKRENTIKVKRMYEILSENFPEHEFYYSSEKSYIKPDGGLVYLIAKDGKKYPILISEVKNQGTNDLREQQGKKKQAKGNAIERLAKNVVCLRTLFMSEDIFPFVCFGYGCDFKEDSTILDRIVTIAMFGKLNVIHLYKEGPFNRGSFYFREKMWSNGEMEDIIYSIAKGSIEYYFSKYGESSFK